MRLRGAIFDLDGTLADTLADLTDAVNVALAEQSLPPATSDQVRAFVGDGLLTLCRRAMAGGDPTRLADIDEARVTQAAATLTAYYRQHRLDKTRPYPGIYPLLEELTRRNVQLAVLTNKPHEHTEPLIAALFPGLPWVAVEGCRDDRLRKPDPQTVQPILARMRLSPRHAVMIGDSPTDVQTGHNAGLQSIAVTWGYRERQALIDAGPNYLVDHPMQILQIL